MNNISNYTIHPYCFVSALPEARVFMSLIDCTQQASEVEVHNDDGFIYSEYKHNGSSQNLKVGYRLPEVISPASAGHLSLQRCWLKMRQVHTYGSIVGGTIPISYKV